MPSGTFGVSNNSAGLHTEIRWWTDDNSGANQSTVYATLWARRDSATTFGNGSWTVTIDGVGYGFGGSRSISTSWVELGGASRVVTHNADGSRTVGIGISGGIPGTSWTTTSGSQNVTLTNYVRLPSAPGTPSASNVTPTTMTLTWTAPSSVGGGILEYRIRYSVNSNFSGATTVSTGTSRTYNASTLSPGTSYYWQASARNSDGWGAWSATRTQATLPSTFPVMLVSPTLNGQGASVALSPPGGASGVTQYVVEYRLLGDTTATTISGPTSPLVVASGLTPGATYEWRSHAMFGSYQSPWTGWTPVVQPNPNTNPGDYFDGSTAARPDLTFSWAGTTNNSRSNATGKRVAGWRLFTDGNATSGGTGEVYRVTGGLHGSHSARVVFFTDCTAAGFIAGVGFSGGAVVEPGSTYGASIYYFGSNRTQRLQAGVAYYNGSGTLLTTTWVADQVQVVNANAQHRFQFLAEVPSSPAGIVRAAPVVRDVSGTSWATWKSGDSFRLDSAMASLGAIYPYFDGDSADVPGFHYQWAGTANESVSERLIVPVADSDPLEDPDCPPLPPPPTPPFIESDCFDETGIWRRYTLQVPEDEVRASGATVLTITMRTLTLPERQVRIRLYPNPDGLAPEDVDLSLWEAEMILSYIPADTVITLDGITRLAWAEVAGRDPVPASRLLYGSNNTPATWTDLTCGHGYVMTLDVPPESPLGNLQTFVDVTHRM